MRLDYLSRSAEDAGDDLHECACRSQVDGLDGAGLQVEGAIGVRVPEAVAGRSALCQMELTGRKALRSPRHIALQSAWQRLARQACARLIISRRIVSSMTPVLPAPVGALTTCKHLKTVVW